MVTLILSPEIFNTVRIFVWYLYNPYDTYLRVKCKHPHGFDRRKEQKGYGDLNQVGCYTAQFQEPLRKVMKEPRQSCWYTLKYKCGH